MASVAPPAFASPASYPAYAPEADAAVYVDDKAEQKSSKSKICLIAAAVFVGLAVMFAVAAVFVSPVLWLVAGLCLITAVVLAIIGGSRDQSHRPTADTAPSEVYHHHLHTSASAPALTGIIVITPAQAAANPDRYYYDSVFGVYRERLNVEVSGSAAASTNPKGGAALTLTRPSGHSANVSSVVNPDLTRPTVEVSGSAAASTNPKGGAALTLTRPSAGSRPNLGSAAKRGPENPSPGTNARAVGLADSQRAAAPASRPPPGSTTTTEGTRKGNPARQRQEGT